MAKFPHLPLRSILDGSYKFKGFSGRGKHARSLQNLQDRKAHGEQLFQMLGTVENLNKDVLLWRREQGLPNLPNETVIPVLLQVDPNVFDIETLKGFGLEVISEEETGFIIGASVDQFRSLKDKIEAFMASNNQGAALLWEIVQGTQWRPEHILTEDLYQKWVNGIADNEEFVVDISISTYIKKSPQPTKSAANNEKSYKKSMSKWFEKSILIDTERDQLIMQRQDQIQTFIELGGGSISSGFVEYDDSFGFRAEISGMALKDIVLNYQYVFEITEHVDVDNQVLTNEDNDEFNIIIEAPDSSSPKVCIIDSGIQENHVLLQPAILNERSICFVPHETTTADLVSNGGHGTKVAGAVLFGNNIPRAGKFQAPFFLANARVLDAGKSMSSKLFPPELMDHVADSFSDIDIFNLSINSWTSCRTKHMSQWAATIDKLSNEREKIFIISAGNLATESIYANRPGIKDYISSGRNYPAYLLEKSSRIADPAQSTFAITVGSVCLEEFLDADRQSFGKRDEPSSFSRAGLGIWDSIKPEVVEYGGDWVRERTGSNLTINSTTSPELVKTGANGVGRIDVGTSFSAPKVTHILGHLKKLFPNESVLFYKALLIQSARLPESVFQNPEIQHLRHFGYGIPNLDRAIDNTPHRITFTETGTIAPKMAKIFAVKIPEELRGPAEAYDILIEVSLCYTAEPRRTRKFLRSYLSSWLSWESSKIGQSSAAFQNDVLKELDEVDSDENQQEPEDPHSIRWSIWSNSQWGKIKGVRRQASANQKDWVILKSYDLPPEISFAVIGHKGWENDLTKEVPYTFVVSFEILNAEVEIYEIMQSVNVEIPIQVNV